MNKFKAEHCDPAQEQRRRIATTAQKIVRILRTENFKINQVVQNKLEQDVTELQKERIDINIDALLQLALEQLAIENGGVFPGDLKNNYLKLLAQKLASDLSPETDIHTILAQTVINLRHQHINIDGEKLQELIDQLIEQP